MPRTRIPKPKQQKTKKMKMRHLLILAIALSTFAASGQTKTQATPKTEQKAQGGHLAINFDFQATAPSSLPDGTKVTGSNFPKM
jgi:hypothetical protein